MVKDEWIPSLEEDMSEPIIGYFKSRNCTVYGEIFDKKGIMDHVAVDENGDLIAIEMKLTCNLQLLFQALKNTWYCNYSYLVFPFTGKYLKTRSPELAKLKYLCEALGIGILKYGRKSVLNPNYQHGKVFISEWLKPKRFDNPKWRKYIMKKLVEERIDFKGGVKYTMKPRRKRRKRS